jgi:hypothetical protein
MAILDTGASWTCIDRKPGAGVDRRQNPCRVWIETHKVARVPMLQCQLVNLRVAVGRMLENVGAPVRSERSPPLRFTRDRSPRLVPRRVQGWPSGPDGDRARDRRERRWCSRRPDVPGVGRGNRGTTVHVCISGAAMGDGGGMPVSRWYAASNAERRMPMRRGALRGRRRAAPHHPLPLQHVPQGSWRRLRDVRFARASPAPARPRRGGPAKLPLV